MYVDFTLFENICNLKCEYCRGSYSYDKLERRVSNDICLSEDSYRSLLRIPSFRKVHFFKGSRCYVPISFVSKQANRIIQLIARFSRVDQLKISGGEITLFPEVIDSILKNRPNNCQLKLLTNGIPSSIYRFLDWKKYYNNLIVQISLDGICQDSNSLRTKKIGHIQKVRSLIIELSNNKTLVEVNSVLTRQSIDDYFKMIKWLSSIDNKIIIYPRPVRNIAYDLIFPTEAQITTFIERLHKLNTQERRMFISDAYIDALCSALLRQGKNSCRVPNNVLAINLFGDINCCTIGGTPSIGNIYTTPSLLENVLRNSRLLESNKWKVCKSCVSEYEIFNFN